MYDDGMVLNVDRAGGRLDVGWTSNKKRGKQVFPAMII